MVSVIALCYNHEEYVQEALLSVVEQDFSHFQLIIVDDASQDKSVAEIEYFLQKNQEKLAEKYIETTFIRNEKNIGNCKSFNKALALATQKYVIDFSTDDILLPQRLKKQVEMLEKLPNHYAVCFSNAQLISHDKKPLCYHYPINSEGRAIEKIPSGDIYAEILQRYFVCTPTMLIKREVLLAIGGYDETLSYEDFDFWIRTARHYHYAYLDEVTTLKRIVKNSLSSHFFQKRPVSFLHSTHKVFAKAIAQNTPYENQLLAKQIRYYLRLAFFTQTFEYVSLFYAQLQVCRSVDFLSLIIKQLSRWKVPVYRLYRWYKKWQTLALC
ncbi:MAG: glycosyltransferase [Microscillaceae bacterium]|nr:glycosyltransferase [Microscillaceae bacterium]MDW8461851.1 glycosyltransferase [Cytophagales bacterium]